MGNLEPFVRGRQGLVLGLFFLSVILSGVLWRPLLLFVFPGILVLFLNPWKRVYLSDLFVFIIGASMAFWIVSFWFLKYIKFSLSAWVYGVILIAIMLFGLGVWKYARRIVVTFDRQEVLVLFLLLSTTALRLSIYWRWPLAPAGADMSMHGYLASLIVDRNGLPSSHQPLLPIEGFGAYPLGFHTLTALISLLGGGPVFRGALLMEAITFAFLTFAFYAFLRAFRDRITSALVAVLVSFLPLNPQNYISWGGIPTVFSLAFVVLGLALLPALMQRMSTGAWVISASLVAASVLTHVGPVVGSLYALVPVIAYWGISRSIGSWREVKVVIRNLAGIGLIGMILITPYLAKVHSTQVSPAEVQWVKDFQRYKAGGAWRGTIGNAVVTIPLYLTKIYGWSFLGLAFLGFAALTRLQPQLAVPGLIFSLAVIGLVINSMYWVLPLSYAIYPERTALLLLPPFSLGLTSLVDGMRRLIPKSFLLWVVALFVLFLAIPCNEKYFYEELVRWSPITEADMQAMAWIRRNTAPHDVFRNSYGDAGLWIPAIAFRPITTPHLNPFYLDEFKEGSRVLEPRYIYIGEKRVYGEPFSRDPFDSRPDFYPKVYDRDGVTIYEITMPTSLDEPQKLAASYTLIRLVPGTLLSPSGVLHAQVKVRNTGQAVWLARAKGDRGAVRLGWRWFKGNQEIVFASGREGLRYDVFPGQSYEFKVRIAPPMESGEYTLELGLVSELVAWFSDQGVEPLKVTVRVVNPPGDDFERLPAKLFKAVGDPPRLAIATDRPRYRRGDSLRLTADLVNPGSSRVIDGYLALRGPDGRGCRAALTPGMLSSRSRIPSTSSPRLRRPSPWSLEEEPFDEALHRYAGL